VLQRAARDREAAVDPAPLADVRLDEREVLALVWRMFGVEDLDLPETAVGVAEG